MKGRPASRQGTLSLMMRAFKYRNYRLFFGGQGISLIGTWMQRIAMSWLVYRLTGSAMLLGVVGFCGQIPTFLLSPIAGVLADRFDRHRILLATQTLAMLQAMTMAWLTLSGRVQVWHIIAISSFLGLVNAFDIPARQSFVIDMVERKEDLGNAIALNSSMFNGARLVGPSVAGVLIGLTGEGVCFLLDGVSYLAVIAALLAMKVPAPKPKPAGEPVLRRLRDGFGYAFGFAPIKFIILLLALTSLTGMPYTVLMPVYVKQVLHGGPGTLGFLMAFSGAGALLSAVVLASRRSAAGLEARIPLSTLVFGLGLLLISAAPGFPAAAAAIALASFGMISQMASSNTIIQTVVDDDKRGRVMAIYAMSFMGMMPFGSILAGWGATHIGVQRTIMLSGILSVLGAAVFYTRLGSIRESVAPVFRRLGIAPEVAAGLESAAELTAPPED
ncbi:MAG: MFS transporter [Elusimicrobia bacterium]|nr:MFS transporter [Elusimicrobiota bacterium]